MNTTESIAEAMAATGCPRRLCKVKQTEGRCLPNSECDYVCDRNSKGDSKILSELLWPCLRQERKEHKMLCIA